MADASYVQSSFLGGQFSENYQGRFDDRRYAEGMNVCLNAFPIEEGAWNRRSGTLFGAPTRGGVPGIVKPFKVSDSMPYVLEFTNGHLRFYSLSGGQPQLVMTPETQVVESISDANPGIVVVSSIPSDWAQDDLFVFGQDAVNNTTAAFPLMNKQWQALNLGETETGTANGMTFADPITGATLDGTSFTLASNQNYFINKVLDLPTSYYNNDWANVRVIQTGALDQLQTEPQAVILCGGNSGKNYLPQVLTFTSPQNSPVFGTFTLDPAIFEDGPYLDPPGNGAYLVASGTSGVITLTVAYQTWSSSAVYADGDYVTYGGLDYQSTVDDNTNNTPSSDSAYWTLLVAGAAIGGVGFQSTDVGRSMRLFSEPPAWVSTTTYSAGQAVKYNGLYYTAQGSTRDAEPDVNPLTWAVTPSAANMVWGRITAVTSATEVSFQLLPVPNINGIVNSGNLLYSGNSYPISQFQMGLYSATTGYPACGVYYQGRLWLGGLIPNRFDTTVSNNTAGGFVFSPTGADGTVADNCGISEVLNSDDVENILWMIPSSQGLIFGTEGGEWLCQASALNDPITPTSIQAMKVSANKCANIEPIHAPMATIFVQKSGRKLLEYFPDVFSGKYSARNLSLRGKVFGKNGFVQIAYQQELSPVVWACDTQGGLYGCTYKRESPFATEEATIVGWHPHQLGSGRKVLSVCTGPGSQVDEGESLEALTMVTQDPDTGICFVETMAKMFEEDDTLMDAWFIDAGLTPSFASNSSDNTTVTFYGLDYLDGKTVDLWGAGLDLGSYTVSNGQITVTYGTANALFTTQYLQNLGTQTNAQGLSTWINYTSPYVLPDGLTSWVDSGSHLGAEGSAWALPAYDEDYVLIPNTSSIDLPDGIRKMKMREGNSLISYKTTAQLFENVQTITTYGALHINYKATYGVGSVATQDRNGNIYFPCTGDNNCTPIAKFDKNLNFLGIMGTPDDNTISSGYLSGIYVNYPWYQGQAYGVALSGSMAAVVAGHTYLVSASQDPNSGGSSLPEIVILDATDFSYVGRTRTQHLTSVTLVAGQQYNDRFGQYSKAYVYGLAQYPDGATTTGVEIFTVIPPTAELVNDYVITPADIDATWTHVESANGLIFDQTDGNLIFGVHTGDAVTNTDYIVKVDPSSGAVVWATAVKFKPAGNTMNVTRIQYGQLCWIDSSGGNVVFCNTANGDITTASLNSNEFTADGVQFYDDVLGLCCFQGAYTAEGSSWPQPLSGSTNFSSDWGAIASPSTQKGPDTTGGSYQVPFTVGFSFKSQGQLLRQIAPQNTGARNGPALGKTRRSHMASALLQNCPTAGVVSWGTDLSNNGANLLPINPVGQDQTTPLAAGGLYSGVYWDSISDDYTFDSMLAWQVTRPYPLTICAIQGFLHTQDR